MLLCAIAFLVGAALAAPDDVIGIPYRPDPPFAIDGDLGDWESVPVAHATGEPSQVVWGKGNWTSAQDMSGTVRLAWRHECLFIAVDVVDDQISQSQRAGDLWRGDHGELYLDVTPDAEPPRSVFGEGQFQIGLSPGNFKTTGDPLADCPPEAFCFLPNGLSIEGAALASARTATGWRLEASIPWAPLGVEAAEGLPIRVEVALSDTDSPTPQQETMLTLGSSAWVRQRERLLMAALAGSDGVAKPHVRRVALFEACQLEQGKSTEFKFKAPETPEGRQAILCLQARLDTPRVAGHTPALRLTLNGTALEGRRLMNKPLRVASRGGAIYSMYAGDKLATYYSPDFRKPEIDPHYGLMEGVKPCLFELDVSDVLREGQNTLVIEHAAVPSVKRILHAADGRVEFRLPPPPPKEKAGPPTGPIPTIEPASRVPLKPQVEELPGSRLRISGNGGDITLESKFSTPKPAWVHESNAFFRHKRTVEPFAEGVLVKDTFENLTADNLPIMHRHEAVLGNTLKRVWLAGLAQPTPTGRKAAPANPSSYGGLEDTGIGLLPLDDVFRTHIQNYAGGGRLGLADNNLVLPPGGTYTAEWAIIPTRSPDYWEFLNAARRLVRANFTIDGGFAFLRSGRLTDPWTDKQVESFIQFKDPLYICSSIPSVGGRYAHGTLFQTISHDFYRKSFARWRTFEPDRKYLVYFHCFLDCTDDGPTRFPNARTLRPDGAQADYGKAHQRLYFPRDDNAYGPAIARNVDIILDDIGADGVYWDEHEYSRWAYHYGPPWDGFSGDIDPESMKVTRLKSSVTLITEQWRVGLAKRILARGPLVGNGAPRTRAMAALGFPCFVETGSISHCTLSHFHTPIALGDHLTERSERDAYCTMMAALDYGCLYHWYNDLLVIPTHPHLTSYMYPFTPVELHEGYIIGAERIITKTSGLFGWGDDAVHEVHVFDGEGREVEGFDAPGITRDGKTYTELRLAEGWSASIARRGDIK